METEPSSRQYPAHVAVLHASAAASEGMNMARLRRALDEYLAAGGKEAAFPSPLLLDKYAGSKVVCYHFSGLEALDKLRERYQSFHGAPSFLTRLLRLEAGLDRMLLHENPQQFAFTQRGDWLIKPTPAYTHLHQRMTHPERARLLGGFRLSGWYIHPNILADSPLALRSVRSDPKMVQALIDQRLTPGEDLRFGTAEAREAAGFPSTRLGKLQRSDSFSRLVSNMPESVHHIARHSEPYLATILDLNAGHIPWLMEIHELATGHLHTVYNVNPVHDTIRLYFHFPCDAIVGTLHLHIAVNQLAHPVDAARSFSLWEVIAQLHAGGSISELVLQRQQQVGGILVDGAEPLSELANLTGITATVCDFYLPMINVSQQAH